MTDDDGNLLPVQEMGSRMLQSMQPSSIRALHRWVWSPPAVRSILRR